MSFSQKVVLVTGGGGGIGRGVARAFAREGGKVFVTDVDERKAGRAGREISGEGGVCLSGRLDVIDPRDVVRGVKDCKKSFGRIDILVNCAGILTILPFDQITPQLWDSTMDVNARGTFLTCQAVAQEMIGQGGGGKIVNISSVAGKLGAPFYTHYCASKWAVLGVTKSLALELAKHRINVNAVCPGDVETEMLEYEFKTHAKIRGISAADVKKQLSDRVPLGRLGLPEDVAKVILFLSSEKADYMTGQALNISGGTIAY